MKRGGLIRGQYGYIAHYGPRYKQEKDSQDKRAAPGDPDHKRADARLQPKRHKKRYQRERQHESRVEAPCPGKIAMKQGVKGTLGAATGTVEAGGRLEPAGGKPSRLRRIKRTVDPHSHDGGSYCRRRQCQLSCFYGQMPGGFYSRLPRRPNAVTPTYAVLKTNPTTADMMHHVRAVLDALSAPS